MRSPEQRLILPPTAKRFDPRQMLALAWRTDGDAFAVCAAAPFLLFPTHLGVPVAVGVIASVALLRWRLGWNSLWPRTPFNLALLLLATMAAIGTAVSPFPDATFPKASGVILGLAVFRAVVISANSWQRIWLAVGVYLFTAVMLIGSGVFAAGWPDKWPSVAMVTSRIPRLIGALPGTDGAVNPNALAGAALFLLPLLMSLVRIAFGFGYGQRVEGLSVRRLLALRLIVVALFIATSLVLVLAQSRTAWVALAVTLLVLLARAHRRVRWALAAVALATGLVIVAVGPTAVAERLWRTEQTPTPGTGFELSVGDRSELWSRGISGVRDFPLAGMGLNAFRRLVQPLYPLFTEPPDADVAHAHNVFLQTALDIGLPGLIAYVALLLIASLLCWQLTSGQPTASTLLVLGVWGNLAAVHVFGVTDAIALGAKVGVLLWFDLALIAAVHALREQPCVRLVSV